MALIKLGALAQDVRGSLNGTTFSRNKGGAYVRSKVSPVQPVSPYSANSRQAFKVVSQAWSQLLTDPDRADWIAFANLHPFINVFGDSINLSGVAFYQAAMKRLQQLGFDIFDTAPSTWDVDPPGVIAPTMSVAGGVVDSLLVNPTNPVPGGNVTALLFATKQIAPGAQPQKTDYRMINALDGTTYDDTHDWAAEYNARFSPYVPPSGSKIAMLYAYLDKTTGALSVPSGATIFETGFPGPLYEVISYQKSSAGGGNVNVTLTLSGPNNIQIGDTCEVAVIPPDADVDGPARVMVAKVGNQLAFGPVTGTPAGTTPCGGTIQALS